MKSPSSALGRLVLCSLAGSALISCMQPAEPSQGQPRASDQQVEQTKQALNTGLPSEKEVYPSKGHTKALLAAFRALSSRKLTPPQMATPESQYYIHYGNYFADNTWVNRPGTLHAQRVTGNARGLFEDTPTAASANMSNAIGGEVLFSEGSASYSWDDSHSGWECWWYLCVPVWIPLDMELRAHGKVRWTDYSTNDKPNTYAEYQMQLNLISRSIAGISQQPVNKIYSLDNLYHYTFREVYQMPGVAQADKDQNATLRLYPLVLSDLGDPADHDIANKAISYIVNQPLVAGADRGITKYGAILYQLARKFFNNSCYKPSLSELIPAGNDIPGFHVGSSQGIGHLSSFSLAFPHTKLGGMPYTCSNGSDPKDMCADGLATWPIWVPEGEVNDYPDPFSSPPYNQRWLAELSKTDPGRSDRAALIYLGWATHMIQDAATPHHAANWVGYEHDRQDNYGDSSLLWELIDLSDFAVSPTVDDLLGPVSNPKTRDQICSSVGITDSQMMNGELNYTSVQPVFLGTATQAFNSRQTSNPNVIAYLRNAYISTIKLLLCAPPAPGQSCPDRADEPLNQGTIAGTHQRYPWDFNVFVFGDAMGLHDVAGPVAAKGAIHLNSFSVNGSGLKPVALVAGGDLRLENGTVYGAIYASGGFTIMPTVTRVPPTLKTESPIDFSTMQDRLLNISQELRYYPPTGATTPTASGVLFAGGLPGYNVFSVSGAALANYRTFELVIPDGASAVINVLNDLPNETPVTFQNAGFNLHGTDPRRVLWNFDRVQKVSMASITFPGSALAASAAVETKYGGFSGTLFAKSLVSTYTEFHWYPFGGDFPPIEETPPGPCNPAPVPTATVTPGDGQVVLNWTASTGATSYRVERKTSTQTDYTLIAIVRTGTTYTDSGVVNGTTYYYVVSANKGSCSSGPSGEVSATPSPACDQAAPTGVTANPGTQQVTLAWTAAPGATRYEIGRSSTSGSGYTSVGTVTAPTTTFLDSDATLANGTTYYYVVEAYNGACGSPNSTEVSATTAGPACTQDAPTGVTATPGNMQVTLTWTAAPGATRYEIGRSSTSGFGYTSIGTVTAPTTTFLDSDATLANGTTYYYVVKAYNAICGSPNSTEVSAMPDPVCIQNAPTGVTATPGNMQVTLTWTAATGAATYHIGRSTTSGTGYTLVGSATAPTTTFLDSDATLLSGTTYYYVVMASNAICGSPNSTEVSVTLAAGCTQAAPTGVTAQPGNRQVTLTWTAASGATRYSVGRSTTSGAGYNSVGNVTAPTTTFLDSDAALVNGTRYYYVVTAYNASCGSPNSTEVSSTPGCSPPAVPTGVTATANNSNGSITVAWGTVSGATAYTVSRSTISGGTYTAVSTNQTATSYTDSTGLSSGSTYYYRVSASNAGGTCASAGSSAVSGASCTLPPVPTGLNATTAGSGKIALTWTASSNANSYEVLRSTTSGSGYVSIFTTTTNNYTDSGLASGTTYYYVVRARNGGTSCSSANSAQVSAKPQGCQVLSSSQGAYTLNTTGTVCFVTCWDLMAGSWNCSSFSQSDRTLTVNGQPVNCGAAVPAKINGAYTFNVGAGGHTWDQINWWDNGTTHAHTCP